MFYFGFWVFSLGIIGLGQYYHGLDRPSREKKTIRIPTGYNKGDIRIQNIYIKTYPRCRVGHLLKKRKYLTNLSRKGCNTIYNTAKTLFSSKFWPQHYADGEKSQTAQTISFAMYIPTRNVSQSWSINIQASIYLTELLAFHLALK